MQSAWKHLLAITLLVAGGSPAVAADYSPYANVEHPTRVLGGTGAWGDTHLHTTNSLDARLLGVTLGVADAYQLARGEQVVAAALAMIGNALDGNYTGRSRIRTAATWIAFRS